MVVESERGHVVLGHHRIEFVDGLVTNERHVKALTMLVASGNCVFIDPIAA